MKYFETIPYLESLRRMDVGEEKIRDLYSAIFVLGKWGQNGLHLGEKKMLKIFFLSL